MLLENDEKNGKSGSFVCYEYISAVFLWHEKSFNHFFSSNNVDFLFPNFGKYCSRLKSKLNEMYYRH